MWEKVISVIHSFAQIAIVGLILLLVRIINHINELMLLENFRIDFWANFYADLFVGVFLVGLIGWYRERSKRLIMEMRGILSGEGKLTLSLGNKGDIGFGGQEVFYHFMFGEGYIFGKKIGGKYSVIVDAEGHKNQWISGIIKSPVYPKRWTHVIHVNIENYGDFDPDDDRYNVSFFVSTPKGTYPVGIIIYDYLVSDYEDLDRVAILVENDER